MRNHAPAVIRIESPVAGDEAYPVEVGAVLHNGAAYCFLVKPLPEWTAWDPGITATLGLARGKLERHGLTPEEVCDALNRALRDESVYSTKPKEDNRLLDLLFAAAGVEREFAVQELYDLLAPGHRDQWERARANLSSLIESERHRASNIARLDQQTFRQLLGAPTASVFAAD